MTNTESPCATAEATIGDQSAVVTTTGAFHRARNSQHLAHTRPALWSLIANHQDRIGLNFSIHNRHHGTIFIVKNARRSFKQTLLLR